LLVDNLNHHFKIQSFSNTIIVNFGTNVFIPSKLKITTIAIKSHPQLQRKINLMNVDSIVFMKKVKIV